MIFFERLLKQIRKVKNVMRKLGGKCTNAGAAKLRKKADDGELLLRELL
jgi:hypothetical protein